MSTTTNVTPATENAAAVRDATAASLEAAVEQLPETRRAEVEALAARLDISDPGNILRFGQDAQNRATAAADAMLEGARNREAGEAGVTLSSLIGTLRGFDMSGLGEKPSFFARIFSRSGAEVAKVVQRYETIKGQVEAVGDRLDTHRTRLLEDVEKLERLYGATLEWFHALGDHIAAGDVVLQRVEQQAIPALAREVEGGDSVAAQRLRDLRSARDELERRVHDLRLTRQVAMQALPSIRLIQENDKALAAKIQSVIANTVPLWRQQLAQALAISRMRDAGRTLKEATDLTNELLTANAERLRQGNLEARTQLERGVFDIEAVKKANASLVATIEDSLRIATDAQAQRASATKELEKAEAEIRRALTAARATRPVERRPM
ncbi:tellurium resistance protein [Siccirubricoccus deserti]|uniref:Toxic anion resistance protein n=1 Tax=Siccirubricoccus deserti TaxID=2013562 RepID=A0A9X0UF45_9PROT|nr:toxic anion resistance protein [Siccirubricoccus deserti]MBC4017546.1 toxic anion resistance protein [Siccirubricoccus deserti]GGC59527.1 tellurium resistance protein [Siccirubricoccus deserti]